jgi:hypothetical protein
MSVTALLATCTYMYLVSMSQMWCCKIPYGVRLYGLCGFSELGLAENAPFKSSGVICWSPPPSSLPDKLSMNKRDSNGFFSTQRVCMAKDTCTCRSNEMTGSSLIVAHWQIPYSGKFSLLQNFVVFFLLSARSIREKCESLHHVKFSCYAVSFLACANC